jgi:cold shock CspA family protein
MHVSALEKAGIETLQEGEEIEFEIGENKGKEHAINVKKVVNG